MLLKVENKQKRSKSLGPESQHPINIYEVKNSGNREGRNNYTNNDKKLPELKKINQIILSSYSKMK